MSKHIFSGSVVINGNAMYTVQVPTIKSLEVANQ
jgi:hypothetical protein